MEKDAHFSSIPKGLLITDLIGTHAADLITGDFSAGANGLWIERGAVSDPLKGFAISGNILTLLENIDDLEKGLACYGTFWCAPTPGVCRFRGGVCVPIFLGTVIWGSEDHPLGNPFAERQGNGQKCRCIGYRL